jgi:hypothetical protein
MNANFILIISFQNNNIMEKHPLTNLGIAQLIAELYALNDNALQVEVDSLLLDFDSWILNHIELNIHQQQYLTQLPLAVKNSMQIQVANSMSLRSPIIFTKAVPMSNPSEPEPPKEGRGKLIGVKRTSTNNYNKLIGIVNQDILEIDISYAIEEDGK